MYFVDEVDQAHGCLAQALIQDVLRYALIIFTSERVYLDVVVVDGNCVIRHGGGRRDGSYIGQCVHLFSQMGDLVSQILQLILMIDHVRSIACGDQDIALVSTCFLVTIHVIFVIEPFAT
jgi:hypothetical protein